MFRTSESAWSGAVLVVAGAALLAGCQSAPAPVPPTPAVTAPAQGAPAAGLVEECAAAVQEAGYGTADAQERSIQVCIARGVAELSGQLGR